MADIMIRNILANLIIERAEEKEPRKYLFIYSILYEDAADRYAADKLIPPEKYQTFIQAD